MYCRLNIIFWYNMISWRHQFIYVINVIQLYRAGSLNQESYSILRIQENVCHSSMPCESLLKLILLCHYSSKGRLCFLSAWEVCCQKKFLTQKFFRELFKIKNAYVSTPKRGWLLWSARYQDHAYYFVFHPGLRWSWLDLRLRLDNCLKSEESPLIFWPIWDNFWSSEDRRKIFMHRGGGHFGLP